MKKSLNTILTLCLFLMLNSCSKEIPYNGEEFTPRLVVNSLCTPGKPFVAELGKSYFFLEQDEDIDTSVPEGLQADLFVNGQYLGAVEHCCDSIEYDGFKTILRQYYTNNYIPVEGDVIKITATAPGFKDVEATTSPLPRKPVCNIVDITMLEHYEIEQNDEWDYQPWFWLKSYAILTLEITDTDPGQANYFYLPGPFDFDAYDENFPHVEIKIRPNLNDPVFENYNSSTNETLFDYYPFKDYAFTDALFDGGSYRIQIPIDLIVNGLTLDEVSQLQPKLQMPVQHLTKEYYQYICTVNYMVDQVGILVEPIHTHSNVRGGYGIVGGNNSQTYEHPVPVPSDITQ